MQTSIKTGLALAAAAAALFATPLVASAADMKDASVKCAGVNSCKGMSECKSAQNECKGQNSCKGQGWQSRKSAAECTKDGGKVVG